MPHEHMSEWFPEFAEKRLFDEKTCQFLCLALAVKGRSAPCVKKHFMGALKAGAILQEVSQVISLTFRESAGNDGCWAHELLSDYREMMKGNVGCGCPQVGNRHSTLHQERDRL